MHRAQTAILLLVLAATACPDVHAQETPRNNDSQATLADGLALRVRWRPVTAGALVRRPGAPTERTLPGCSAGVLGVDGSPAAGQLELWRVTATVGGRTVTLPTPCMAACEGCAAQASDFRAWPLGASGLAPDLRAYLVSAVLGDGTGAYRPVWSVSRTGAVLLHASGGRAFARDAQRGDDLARLRQNAEELLAAFDGEEARLADVVARVRSRTATAEDADWLAGLGNALGATGPMLQQVNALLAPVEAVGPLLLVREVVPVFTDPDTPIVVRAGETFSVLLESNSSTGYGWALADSLAPGVLRLVGHRYENPEHGDDPVVGAPGRERWTFQALRAGQTRLRMAYRRSWERAAAARTTQFQVEIR